MVKTTACSKSWSWRPLRDHVYWRRNFHPRGSARRFRPKTGPASRLPGVGVAHAPRVAPALGFVEEVGACPQPALHGRVGLRPVVAGTGRTDPDPPVQPEQESARIPRRSPWTWRSRSDCSSRAWWVVSTIPCSPTVRWPVSPRLAACTKIPGIAPGARVEGVSGGLAQRGRTGSGLARELDWSAFNLRPRVATQLLDQWQRWARGAVPGDRRHWPQRDCSRHASNISASLNSSPALRTPQCPSAGASDTSAYSWSKGLELLDLGRAQLQLLPERGMRLDTEALESALERSQRERQPVP